MNKVTQETSVLTLHPLPSSEPQTQTESAKLGGVEIGCRKIKKALTFSAYDGVFASGMSALTDTFSVAGAVFLNAPAMAIAMLGSLPLLLSSIVQLFLPRILKVNQGRKYYVIKGALLQCLFLILLSLCGWFPVIIRPWSYVIIFALYGFSGSVISGLWIAWMGDLVPPQIRGRHFAWRNRIFSFTQLGCTLIAGSILHNYNAHNAPWALFAIVFLIAASFRLLSIRMLHCQCEPVSIVSKTEFSFKHILQSQSFVKYVLATALMQGTVALAGPFFNVFYIRDLKFDFFTLSAATAATIIGSIVSLPLWGKLSDKFGNRTVVLITGFLICTVPLPYVVSSLPWHIWILNFYTGFAWSGYNLSNFNFLLAASGDKRPELNITFSVAVTGICVFICSIIGGLIVSHLPLLFTWHLQSLFLLSGVLRLVVYCIFYPGFPEYETAKSTISGITDRWFAGFRKGQKAVNNVVNEIPD